MEVQLVELRSEIGAGTRGASRGIDAMIMASLNLKLAEDLRREADWNEDEWTEEEVKYREERYQDDDMPWNFFRFHKRVSVPTQNEKAYEPIRYRWAKRIEEVIKVYESTVEVVSPLVKKFDKFPIVLAGDHSTAGATIKSIKNAFPKERVGVIWIDAHGDLHSPYTSPSGNMHGMPLCIALAEDNKKYMQRELPDGTLKHWEKLKNIGFSGPAVQPEDIVLIGVRSLELPERKIIEERNINSIHVREVREEGYHKVIERSMELLKDCDRVYVSFDIDSIDSTISAGTGTPVPDGLFVEEAMGLLNTLSLESKVCCIEMVEVNPFLDKGGNKTGEIAFELLYEMVKTIENQR